MPRTTSSSQEGLNENIVREMSAMKKEPSGCATSVSPPQALRAPPMAAWFAVNMPDLDFDDIYYYIKPTGSRSRIERPARRHQEHLREAGHPRGRAQVPRRVTAQYESEVVFTATVRTRVPRCALLRHGHRGARVPRARPQVLRDDHPPNDNKFAASTRRCGRRVVHLRPEGVVVDQPLQATSASTRRTWASSSAP